MIKTNGIWQLNRDPSCLAYYDADVGNVVLNSGNVSFWKNSSTIYTESARDAVQYTALNQPAYIQSDSDFAGHGSISFGGTHWLATGTFSAAYSPVTYVIVYRFTGSSNYQFLVDGVTSGFRNAIFHQTPTLFTAYAGGGTGVQATVTTGTFAICVVFNGASSQIFTGNNWTTASATGNAGTQTMKNLLFGSEIGNVNLLTGKIAMVGAFGAAWGSTERLAAKRIIGPKYGIVLS
mgnify:CR=1 FL=1